MDGLASAVEQNELARSELFFAIWAATPEHAERLASRVPGPFVLDNNGVLSRACEIRATPTVLIVSERGYSVIDYSLEGDTQWAINRLTSLRPLAAA